MNIKELESFSARNISKIIKILPKAIRKLSKITQKYEEFE